MSDQKTPFEEMAAVLDDHQITDDDGKVSEEEQETSLEETAASEEKTTEEDSTSAEKPAETEEEDTQTSDEGTETQLAEDESGKRYVPESRFKEVYGKAKAAQREAEQLRALIAKGGIDNTSQQQAPIQSLQVDKTEALEVELLKGKLPQFDPESTDYSETLDKLGAEIFKANPGITRIDAAKRAMQIAKEVASTVSQVKAEAQAVKSIQSDQGITGKGGKKPEIQPDFDKMSDQEIEAFLKKTGQW